MELEEWKLSITWNKTDDTFDLKVEPDSVFVGLSLAALADRVLRRCEARAEAAHMMADQPRIFPGAMPAVKGPLG